MLFKMENMELLFEIRETIFQSLKKQINDTISNWKQILNRLLDSTLFLSEQGFHLEVCQIMLQIQIMAIIWDYLSF